MPRLTEIAPDGRWYDYEVSFAPDAPSARHNASWEAGHRWLIRYLTDAADQAEWLEADGMAHTIRALIELAKEMA